MPGIHLRLPLDYGDHREAERHVESISYVSLTYSSRALRIMYTIDSPYINILFKFDLTCYTGWVCDVCIIGALDS